MGATHGDSLKLPPSYLSASLISFALAFLSTILARSFHASPPRCAPNVTYALVFSKHAIGFSLGCCHPLSVLLFLIFGCIALIFPVFSFLVFLLLIIRSCPLACYFGLGYECERYTGFRVKEDVCRHGVLLIPGSRNKSYLCISLCLSSVDLLFQLNISCRLADVWHL